MRIFLELKILLGRKGLDLVTNTASCEIFSFHYFVVKRKSFCKYIRTLKDTDAQDYIYYKQTKIQMDKTVHTHT